MLPPTVYLVGAGPGAPDLISARGLRCLQAADVVIYDHLVSQRLLQGAAAHAERIDVGAAEPERQDQEAICYLIAEKAREGKRVVRLKWGDPFVFDHGGVEAIFLADQGIPFEVVPGLPAAIGVPAYAGIPVTHPGSGSTLTLVRGHDGDGRSTPRVDWQALARLDGTLVCHAAARQFPRIAEALVAGGRAAGTPAAVITHGTFTSQQTWTGTLGDLTGDAAPPPAGPGVLVVGGVVGLRERLRWFDGRPLFGRRVLVTRSRDQAGELVDLLEAQGAEAIEAPLIAIVPPDDYGPLDAACQRAGAYDWIVFTSVNGVHAFMERLYATGGDARRLADAKLCAVGPGTAGRLKRHGLLVDLVADDHRAEGVVAALKAAGPVAGARVLFPKADIARDVLPEDLRAAGATVDEVVAYRTVTAESDAHLDIYRQLLDRRIDVVTFSSASAVRAFVAIYGDDQAVDLLSHTVVATIGPVTAEAALRYRITPTITPATSTLPAFVEAIVAYFLTAPGGDGGATP